MARGIDNTSIEKTQCKRLKLQASNCMYLYYFGSQQPFQCTEQKMIKRILSLQKLCFFFWCHENMFVDELK